MMDSIDQPAWQRPAALPPLAPDEVHVWLAEVPLLVEESVFWPLLDEDERTRAEAMARHFVRERFVQARGLLRLMLSRYLPHPAAAIRFRVGPAGKPEIAVPAAGAVEFNLAHTDGFYLYAFCRNQPVGVDIERIRPMRDAQQVARRMFSPVEYQGLCALPESERLDAFFCLWARKEAYVKALGAGLSFSLTTFSMPIGGLPAPFVPITGSADPDWRLAAMPTTPECKCGLVVRSKICSVRFFRLAHAQGLPDFL
jgi:4'-phosphopantetheinyl transferase